MWDEIFRIQTFEKKNFPRVYETIKFVFPPVQKKNRMINQKKMIEKQEKDREKEVGTSTINLFSSYACSILKT